MKELKSFEEVRLQVTPEVVAREAARQVVDALVREGFAVRTTVWRQASSQLWALCKGCSCSGARDFYRAVESSDHVLTIQTADQALWANVLLTVGVRTP